MKKAAKAMAHPVRVLIESEVARQVRQHSRSSMKTEVCGVLIGREEGSLTIVDACIAGANAAQGGAHVTFTQDTWEHIYQIKDKKYPDARIVGWYHSHPGFGVFLSDHDLFIHEHFFSSPQQIAWVYDPHNDEEGCFGWRDKTIAKIDDVAVRFGQPAGEALSAASDEYEQDVVKVNTSPKEDDIDFWGMLRYAVICSVFFVIGGAAAFFYISNKAILLPKEGSAMLYLHDGKVDEISPALAQHMLNNLQRELQEQRRLPALTQPNLPPATGNNQGTNANASSTQSAPNDRKK